MFKHLFLYYVSNRVTMNYFKLFEKSRLLRFIRSTVIKNPVNNKIILFFPSVAQ